MKQRTLRSRRTRRGAAMVEAVVVIPFFILIFACMGFVVNLYAHKQRTVREAKEDSWTYAMRNCEGTSGDATGSTDTQPMDDLSGLDPNVNGDPLTQFNNSDPGTDKYTKSWGTASSTSKASVTADVIMGGFTNNLSTTTRVQCNEKPQNGNARGVFKFAWNMFKQW